MGSSAQTGGLSLWPRDQQGAGHFRYDQFLGSRGSRAQNHAESEPAHTVYPAVYPCGYEMPSSEPRPRQAGLENFVVKPQSDTDQGRLWALALLDHSIFHLNTLGL